ncbi:MULTISPECIES: NADH oxidoreductase [Providencia]|uniref:NADH oxidoreductase n=1 Tax=Providencia TaxID=586 RepID=UPI0019824562|nr:MULTISPECIES: NADH oxidoreductase [Providencia]MBN4863985.1 NADH oxidoreductase [Providencia stuartii]MBN4873307.1 NADH oxidoreductase [Providencia stuartii]MBN4877572.1 NADH oxidoreductase [Providencia stuartii]MBN4882508.1 NADH oxidoreductase [Providencia stuartii]
MTMPSSLCPNRMQIHSIIQETSDVWTINLINHDFYMYSPGQYALVSIKNSDDVMRAYTLSSSPGQSRYISITVRRLEDGMGSNWLTRAVKPGDYLWLSEAQGEFTCANVKSQQYLMLAAGCGVTPIMSMTRWLMANRPETHVKVLFNVRDDKQVIFAQEWQQLTRAYPERLQLCIMAETPDNGELAQGRLNEEKLQALVPDIASRVVMTCGPVPYMKNAQQFAANLGVPAEHFFMERFSTEPEVANSEDVLTLKIRQRLADFKVPVGISLLSALEQNKQPVIAACRAGVCGSCKTKVLSGNYTTTSTMTLTAAEIAEGYVLACSCQLQGDTEIA